MKPEAIDVSHWQGKVDWTKVKASGINRAFIKATQGVNGRDEYCLPNATNAVLAGMEIGYYHFASLNDKDEVKDAKAEAEWFVKILKTLPSPTLPVVLDIEDNKTVLAPDETLEWITTFFDTLEANGVMNYVLYTYTPFANSKLPTGHGLGARVRLWLASYTKAYKIPNGWDKVWCWQYSCEGSIPGVTGRVDLNIFPK